MSCDWILPTGYSGRVAGGRRASLVEGVRSGEELPNGDGTYQLRTSLTITEESQGTQSYSCLVIHSSVSENITVTWVPKKNLPIDIITGAVLCLALFAIFTCAVFSLRRAATLAAVMSFFTDNKWWKRRAAGHHAEPVDDHKTGGPAEKFPFLTME